MFRALLLVLPAFADSFDVYTFDAPPGYTKRQRESVVELTKINQARKYYCQFGLYRAQPSVGSAAQDADTEWKAIVLSGFKQRGAPVSKPLPLPDAPDSVVLAAETIDNNGNKAISSLFLIRRRGQYVGITFHVPHAEAMEACQNDAGTIVTSLRFATAPSAPMPTGGGIVGVWERVTASPPAGRYNYATKQWQYDPVAAMNQFRHQWRYRFENNGTFSFELDGEDSNRNERTYSVERGSYSLNGGSLTLTPRECQAGKSPRGQNTPLKPCAVPPGRTSRIAIGEHPQYKDSVGLQFLEKDGSWVTYKPAR